MKLIYTLPCVSTDIETVINNYLNMLGVNFTLERADIASNDEFVACIENASTVKVDKSTLGLNDLDFSLKTISELIYTASDKNSFECVCKSSFAALKRCPQHFRCNDKDTIKQLATDHVKAILDSTYISAIKLIIQTPILSEAGIRAAAYIKTKAADLSIYDLKRLEYRIRSSKEMSKLEKDTLICAVLDIIKSFLDTSDEFLPIYIRSISMAHNTEQLNAISKKIQNLDLHDDEKSILLMCINERKAEFKGEIHERGLLSFAKIQSAKALLLAHSLFTLDPKCNNFYETISKIKKSINEIKSISTKDFTVLKHMINELDIWRKKHYDKLIAEVAEETRIEQKIEYAKKVRNQYE